MFDGYIWLYSSVYGASDTSYYNQCWKEFSDIRLLFGDPWLISGDFNAMIFRMIEICLVAALLIEDLLEDLSTCVL